MPFSEHNCMNAEGYYHGQLVEEDGTSAYL